jgi:D-alanine-D-alanine ligase
VIRALDPERFEAFAIGITRERDFVLISEDVLAKLRVSTAGMLAIADRLEAVGAPVEIRRGQNARVLVAARDLAGTPLAELDVMFPVLHGPFGEDGILQGLLEHIGVPYVGNGVLASAIGMDKIAMKRAFIAEGIPVTPHVWFDEARWVASSRPESLIGSLRYPLFVKPANLGSSIGVSRVVAGADLAGPVRQALQYDPLVIVEQGVIGREIECSVLGGFEPKASVVGEVTVNGGWFDYQQKYFGASDPMIVPAALPDHIAEEVRDLSVRAFQAVGCWGLARVDFLYDETASQLYVNELNTLPGFTAHSMYPKLWAACGIDYPGLLSQLVDLAFERHRRWTRRLMPVVNMSYSVDA